MIHKPWFSSSRSLRGRMSSVMFGLSLAAILTMVFSPVQAIAQTTNNGTRVGLMPGSPAGSYSLSDFEDINLYNGSLNFSLPILPIGERGGAGYAMKVNIQQSWSANLVPGSGLNDFFYQPVGIWPVNEGCCVTAEPRPFSISSPGSLFIHQQADNECPAPTNVAFAHTDLRFTASDGTQYVLRDQIYDGQTRQMSCPGPGVNRGTVFVTRDGTAMTFVSDYPIEDSAYNGSGGASGHLWMRDGTCYRFDGGGVTWIRDRNGNMVRFPIRIPGTTIPDPRFITDSLNRQVTIEYNVSDVAPYGVCDRVRFKGASGSERIIRISKTRLSNALRTTQHGDSAALWTYKQLFDSLNENGTVIDNVIYNPGVHSAVWLPDGRSYQFKYNVYGELARVTLPTGGAIEYDFDGGAPGVTPHNGVVLGPGIYRRLIARRVYPDGGSGAGYERLTTYDKGSEWVGPPSLSVGHFAVSVNHFAPGNSQPLASEKHYFFGNPAKFLRFFPEDEHYPPWGEGKEWKTESLDHNGSVLRRVEHTWRQRGGTIEVGTDPSNDTAPPNDPRIVQTVTTLVDANLVSKQTFDYDLYNNQTDVREYGFGVGAPGPLIRRPHTDYVTINNGVDYAANTNIDIRNMPLQQQVFDAGGTKRAETFYEYDLYDDSTNHAPLINRQGISGLDSGFTTGYTTRGNVTRTSSALLNNSGGVTGWVNSHAQYDIAGNLVKAIDANGNPTTLDFSDRFGSPGDDAELNTPPAELNGQTAYAFATKVTNALGHTAYTKYDYYLGKPDTIEDANGIVSSVAYNDALDRPTQGIQARYKVTTPPCEPPSACVPAEKRQTTITYDDANHVITTTGDRDAFGDNILTGKSYYDGLGRTWRGAAYEGSTNWTIKDTQFDALGRVSQVSNPYRATDPGSASPPAGLWTTTDYDALSRVIKVTTPDGAHVDTAYSGDQVTVTDQAGKKRSSQTDALGRLVKVTEDPGAGGLNYDTTYLYDALGNLRKVTQGAQTRWFAYDSLSRLIRSKNPEQNTNGSLPAYTDPVTDNNQWSMAYKYDPNSNLIEKTDARNIKTTYGYDGLNRNTTVSYSDSTPGITRTYDTATLGKGRLQKTETAGGMGSRVTINAYDAMGRPLSQSQQFFYLGAWGTSYTTSPTYDLAGNVKTMTYPSGLITANYSYDQAGRLSGSTLSIVGVGTYTGSDSIEYNAAGQMIKERFGTRTPLYHNLHYNNRLQLVDTRLGDSATDEWNWSRGAISFLYGTNAVANWDMFASDADNNGNLRRQLNYVPLAGGGYVIPQQHDYYYDALNRITAVREQQRDANGQWADSASQAYSYDRWGNRTLDLSGGGGGEVVWVDDALPAGASAASDGGDSWTWVNSNPSPYSGTVSHQSNIAAGEHQHFFYGATQTLQVNAGDRLYAYVYLDPANMPQEVMLQWSEVSAGWSYKAYWGANLLTWPVERTKINVGSLPAAGGWVRLEVPASSLGLEGKTLNGMAFTLYGGRASWDKAGKVGLLYGAGPPINNRVYTMDAGSNRLTSVDGVMMNYDDAGNQTNEGSGLRTYDAENRMLTATNGGVGGSYTYDADSERVKRITAGQEWWYVYGIGGELVAEYLASAPTTVKKEYGYRGGQMLVVWNADEPLADKKLKWLVTDHLGSTRMEADKSGSLAGMTRRDYAPFGEELSAGIGIRSASLGYSDDSVRQKFGSKERDIETGLDFFEARYFSSVQGRFTSPDEFAGGPTELFAVVAAHNPTFYADILDPQSLNKYAYCLNNPLIFVDPDGHQSRGSDNLSRGIDLNRAIISFGNKLNEIENNVKNEAKSVVRGVGKELGNAYVSMHNDSAMIMRALGYEAEDMEYYQPSNETEAIVMGMTAKELILAGGLGKGVPVNVAIAEGEGAAVVASEVRAIRNAHLAGGVHPKTGVSFDAKGFPDFKAAGVVKAEVRINPTGTRAGDFSAANKAAGFKKTPKGYTWHHHQDGTTMQLVPRKIHAQTGHDGGFKKTKK